MLDHASSPRRGRAAAAGWHLGSGAASAARRSAVRSCPELSELSDPAVRSESLTVSLSVPRDNRWKNWKEGAAGRPSPPVAPSGFCRFLGIFCGAPRPPRSARWPPAFGGPLWYGSEWCLCARCRRRCSAKRGSRLPGRWAQLVLRFRLPCGGAGRPGFAWPAGTGLATKRPVLRFGDFGRWMPATGTKNAGPAEGPFGNLRREEEPHQPATVRARVSRVAPQHGVALAAHRQRRPGHECRRPTCTVPFLAFQFPSPLDSK